MKDKNRKLVLAASVVVLVLSLTKLYFDVSSLNLFVFPSKSYFMNTIMVGSPSKPHERSQPEWQNRHAEYVKEAHRGNIGLLFLGDSITQYMNDYPDTLKGFFPSHAVKAFGLCADGTQHLLWRVENGELEGLKPRVVVLLIGTNNVPYYKDDEIADGVKTILHELRARLPKSKILLLGLLPREFRPDNPLRQRITSVNKLLQSLADKSTIYFADVGDRLLLPDGQLSPQLMPDALHPSKQGYEAIFSAIKPQIDQLW